jgi:hypothetical protein
MDTLGGVATASQKAKSLEEEDGDDDDDDASSSNSSFKETSLSEEGQQEGERTIHLEEQVKEVIEEGGINGRTVEEAFSVAASRVAAAPDDTEFVFEVEYLEVYNETVRDLLADNNNADGSGSGSGSSSSAHNNRHHHTINPQNLEIRQTPDGKVVVPGVTRKRLTCVEDLAPLLALGASRRHTGSHKMNNRSSRSHAILTLVCTSTCTFVPTRHFNFFKPSSSTSISPPASAARAWGQGEDDGDSDGETGDRKSKSNKKNKKKTITVSKLHLVDLAGSERVAKTEAVGERLKEANSINKSLAALGDVITALTSKKADATRTPSSSSSTSSAAAAGNASSSSLSASHVPFRNSKLTYLLQDSLSGSSKVLMICAVAPTQRNVGETICSLNFASRCRAVQLTPSEGRGGGEGKGASGSGAVRRLEAKVRELEIELFEYREEAAAADDNHGDVGGSAARGRGLSKGKKVASQERSGYAYAHGKGDARNKENGATSHATAKGKEELGARGRRSGSGGVGRRIR